MKFKPGSSGSLEFFTKHIIVAIVATIVTRPLLNCKPPKAMNICLVYEFFFSVVTDVVSNTLT